MELTGSEKEFKDRVREHILSNYSDEDYPNTTLKERLVEAVEAVKTPNSSFISGIQLLVQYGEFLTYYDDMREFLEELGFDTKKWDDDRVMHSYTNVIVTGVKEIIRK